MRGGVGAGVVCTVELSSVFGVSVPGSEKNSCISARRSLNL